MLLLLVVTSLLSLAYAGKYTVTDEAWFEVEVKDLDGPGEDYHGRFTIALMGETAPMTVMNFAAITRGYKKGKVSTEFYNSHFHIYQGVIWCRILTGGPRIFK